MLKKTILLILAFSTLLAACTRGGETPPTPTALIISTPSTVVTATPSAPTATPEPVNLAIWVAWQGGYMDALRILADSYTSLHPEVTIDIILVDDMDASLQTAIPGGAGPDVIAWTNDKIGTQALVGNIIRLNDAGVDDTFLASTYEPAAAAGVTWQQSVWGLPASQDGIAFVYNKSILSGDFLPKGGQDMEDLLYKAALYASTNPGRFLFCNEGLAFGDAYHAAPFFFGFGLPAFVDDQGLISVNSPESIAAGYWLAQLRPYHPTGAGSDACRAMMLDGTVAAWWTDLSSASELSASGMDLGVLPLARSYIGTKTYFISRNARDRGTVAAAVEMVKYLTNAENSALLAVASHTVPANTRALASPEVQAFSDLAGFGSAFQAGIPLPATPFANAQWVPVGQAVLDIWYGYQTPETALAIAQAAIADAILNGSY